MTDTATPVDPSPAVIIGPEVHSAGLHAETVSYALPFGGRLVIRVEQSKRHAGSFHARYGQRSHEVFTGSRADVLAAIETHAQFLADRETRRRAGSTDPADHAQPPSNLPPAEVWQTLSDAYHAWWTARPAHGPQLPDQFVTIGRAFDRVGGLPWEIEKGYRPQPGPIRDETYRAAYAELQQGWADSLRTFEHLRDARDRWGW